MKPFWAADLSMVVGDRCEPRSESLARCSDQLVLLMEEQWAFSPMCYHVLRGGWPHAQSLRFGGTDYGLWLLCGLNYSTAMSDEGIEPLILAVWARKELSVGCKGRAWMGVILKMCINFAFFAGGGGKALCVIFFPSSDLSFVDFNFMVDNSKPIFHSLFRFLSFSSEQKGDWCVFNQLMPKLLLEIK